MQARTKGARDGNRRLAYAAGDGDVIFAPHSQSGPHALPAPESERPLRANDQDTAPRSSGLDAHLWRAPLAVGSSAVHRLLQPPATPPCAGPPPASAGGATVFLRTSE